MVNTPASWQARVPHHARSAAAVRRWLAGLAGDLHSQHLADLHAVATELICNAVRHATPLPDGDLSVHFQMNGGTIEFAVTDGGASTRPFVRALNTSASDGRGLLIVTALAEQWGVRDESGGRTVWARLTGTDVPPLDEVDTEPLGAPANNRAKTDTTKLSQ
ncbi:ATP-binding protein [Stackebrandtia nassauensis]|nr:ATP-binding protein [Stackebrandtia nassauensis]